MTLANLAGWTIYAFLGVLVFLFLVFVVATLDAYPEDLNFQAYKEWVVGCGIVVGIIAVLVGLFYLAGILTGTIH